MRWSASWGRPEAQGTQASSELGMPDETGGTQPSPALNRALCGARAGAGLVRLDVHHPALRQARGPSEAGPQGVSRHGRGAIGHLLLGPEARLDLYRGTAA